MAFGDQLKDFKTRHDKELKKYFDLKLQEARSVSPLAEELAAQIADLSLRGGKRIRAALLYCSYLSHGGKDEEMAMQASLAMELSETYLLIHDDIMDDDSLRRGGTTIHHNYGKMAMKKYRRKVDPKQFGSSIAMCAGNIASAMSYEIISKLKCDEIHTNRVLRLLSEIYILENYGQSLDLFSQVREKMTHDDGIKVQELKTVPYTFDGPVKIGAILAGAGDDEIKKLESYTLPLGIAFQIQDDILGVFGSTEKTGKPIISDLKEGKKTLLILDALQVADKKQRKIIEHNLGNKWITKRGFEAVKKIIVDTGALEKSKKIAHDLAEKAEKAMVGLDLEKNGKKFLVDIADYIVNREY